MKGTMFIKKLNKRQRCIVSNKDYDEKVGGEFWFVLDPFLNCEDEPFFYYLQLSLAGVPAIIKHQNALSRELWSVWKTPAFVFQYHRFHQYENYN